MGRCRCFQHVAAMMAVLAVIVSEAADLSSTAAVDAGFSSSSCIEAQRVVAEVSLGVGPQLTVNTAAFYPICYDTPLHKQLTEYTCGPASMLSALTALGFPNLTEAMLAAEMHTNESFGTLITEMLGAATRRHLDAALMQNATIEDLRHPLSNGQLVIVLYEAWADEPTTPGPNVWDSGHFSVLFGLDADNVYLMDPWLGVYGYIPIPQFLNERWHSPDPYGAFGICQRCFLSLGGQPGSGRVVTRVPRPEPLVYIG